MNILIITNLVLPAVTPEQLAAIEAAAGPGSRITVAGNRPAALAAAPEAEVILGGLDPELFAAAPRLRWLQSASSGIDHLLFPAFRDSDIPLTGEKGLVGPHLADHAMALLLALSRQVAPALRDGPDSWRKRYDYRHREFELSGLTMGIVGLGGTGRALAQRAAGFDMRVRAVDRDPVPGTAHVARVEPLEQMPAMLADSDVVALCAPLTQETAGMFDAGCFAAMKPGAILLNVTRGGLVVHGALLEALRSGHLGGAGLDVHHLEPLPPDDPLWGFDNVVLTPHTAGASQFRAGRNLDRFVENLGRFRRGEPLAGLVDKTLGY
jgi:phosphoglycerate dehydrogenase-like enzyme